MYSMFLAVESYILEVPVVIVPPIAFDIEVIVESEGETRDEKQVGREEIIIKALIC